MQMLFLLFPRIIMDEAALHLSDKCNTVAINLSRDYVRVMDMGLLELTITAVKSDSDGEQTEPRFELHCSSDVVHIRTCSDSCAALMNLIQYVASYGDLHAPHKAEMKPGVPQRKPKVQGRHPSHWTSFSGSTECLQGGSPVTSL